MTNFGTKVKIKLLELGKKQKWLAEKLGVRENYLSEVLSGAKAGKKYRDQIIEILEMEDGKKSA